MKALQKLTGTGGQARADGQANLCVGRLRLQKRPYEYLKMVVPPDRISRPHVIVTIDSQSLNDKSVQVFLTDGCSFLADINSA